MALRGGPIGSSSSAITAPGWRPDDFSHFLTDFLDQGVVKGNGGELAVSQRGAGANMSVDVATGKALISVTTALLNPNYTLKPWLTNDATLNVAVPAADLTNPRIDRIVAKFDPSVDPNAAASNIVSIELVEGAPAASPSAPSTPSNAISLATVAVAAGATSIITANITDTRTYVQPQSGVLSYLARLSELASTANGYGASLVGIEDVGGYFTATTVEGALQALASNTGVPSGTVVMWTTDAAPTGFLLCYGQAVSRATYSALFAVIGTTYGSGDGSTTFNVPDLRGRFPLGQDDMGGSSANRVTATQADNLGQASGAETTSIAHTHTIGQTTDKYYSGGDSNATLDSASSTGAMSANETPNVMNPYLTLNFIIKY